MGGNSRHFWSGITSGTSRCGRHALVDHPAAHAQHRRTLACLDRMLPLEPAHEEAHRRKMSLLALDGQRAATPGQYEACRQAVHALEAEPDGETTALYERIRTGADLPVPYWVPVRIRTPGHTLHAPPDSPGRAPVLARALAWQGVFCHRLGRPEQAWKLLQHSRQWLEDLAGAGLDPEHDLPEDIQRGRAFVLWRLGNLAPELDRGAAQQLYQQSLALYRAVQDSWGTASVLQASRRVATFSNESDLARHAYAESMVLRQAQGDVEGSYRVVSLSVATTAYRYQTEEEPGEPPVLMASSLLEVGLAIGAGQFAKVESQLAQRLNASESSRAGGVRDLVELLSAFNQMHLGHYERARAQTMACLARFRETGYRWGMERCCRYPAIAVLATNAYSEAQRWLSESAGLCREIKQRGHLGQALAFPALAARPSGDLPQARPHLCEALRVAQRVHDYETFTLQMIAVSTIALLLADEGQLERAAEWGAMASRYPLVANSRLLEDLAGRPIAAIAAQLPADNVAAAKARGRARDLERAIADMLSVLGG